jgi:acyl-CoA synthetase (AMP-forming)/AMP-acid ligase II
LLLYNGPEYYEGFLAALKARMVPINVNYRYVDDELVYLLDDSDAEALVFHASLGETVGRVADRVPHLRLLVEVEDAPPAVARAQRYEELLSRTAPAPRIARRRDDELVMYTGGTTGMPKGVVFDIGDWTAGVLGLVPFVLGIPPLPDAVDELIAHGAARIASGTAPVVMPCSPLMHTAGLGNSAAMQVVGGRAVTLPGRSLDPEEIWSTVERERVTVMIIIGDAFARPLLDALEQEPSRRDLSSLRVILSSGVMWSAPVKQGLLRHVDATLLDGIGATEGAMGLQVTRRDTPVGQTGQFIALADTKLFSEDGREITPGSEEPGLIAAGGTLIPKRYHKGPGEISAHVPRDRRQALRLRRRLGQAQGRRHARPVGSRLGVHQLGRREGVHRRGRRSDQDPSRDRRRPRRRDPRRALRPARHRCDRNSHGR